MDSSDEEPTPPSGTPLELSEEESLVLLCATGDLSPGVLSEATGMPVDKVEVVVARLTRLGLLEKEEEPVSESGPGTLSEFFPTLDDLMPLYGVSEAISESPLPVDDGIDLPSLPEVDDEPTPEDGSPKKHEAAKPKAAVPSAAPASAAGTPAPAQAAPVLEREKDDGGGAEKTREYKKLFEKELHPLPVDQRAEIAKTGSGDHLFALCFDPDPYVVIQLLQNVGTSIDHIRLLAFHHHSGRGLEAIGLRSDYIKDSLTARRLVRNPALTDTLLKKILMPRRLFDIWKTTLDRDVPGRSRTAAHKILRSKWAMAQPEERVDIVLSSEGRVLGMLTGLNFDSKMTKILCSRQVVSVMLIQSLSRFPATPPALLGHLLKQPLVKRQPHLRNQLLQHPNTPGEAKRRM